MVWFAISGIIAIIIVALAAVAIPVIRAQREAIRKTGKYPEGYWVGWGMAIGMAIGMPLGIAMGNIALGPGMGLPIGLAIGVSRENELRKAGKIRPLTKKEKEARKKSLGILMGVLALGVVAALAALFLF
jgi:hypothetical protein